jgi:predicted nucleic acid-binding protein
MTTGTALLDTIAATAQVHGLVLISNNLAHSRRLPDLRTESWRAGSDV